MKKIMALLTLCILSSASAMNKKPKDPYLREQHYLWESIDEPSTSKFLKNSHRDWEEELTLNPCRGYAPTNASVFNPSLCI